MNIIEKTPKAMKCMVSACPAIFETDGGVYLIIGRKISNKQIIKNLKERIGPDEILIEIPKQLLTNL